MTQDDINNYQAGGDYYNQIAAQYGVGAANTVAQAALTGDATQVGAALGIVKDGQPLDSSFLDALGNQLATDPLGAPLASLNNVLSNTLSSLFKSPAVLIVGAVIIFFVFFDGLNVLKKKLT